MGLELGTGLETGSIHRHSEHEHTEVASRVKEPPLWHCCSQAWKMGQGTRSDTSQSPCADLTLCGVPALHDLWVPWETCGMQHRPPSPHSHIADICKHPALMKLDDLPEAIGQTRRKGHQFKLKRNTWKKALKGTKLVPQAGSAPSELPASWGDGAIPPMGSYLGPAVGLGAPHSGCFHAPGCTQQLRGVGAGCGRSACRAHGAVLGPIHLPARLQAHQSGGAGEGEHSTPITQMNLPNKYI